MKDTMTLEEFKERLFKGLNRELDYWDMRLKKESIYFNEFWFVEINNKFCQYFIVDKAYIELHKILYGCNTHLLEDYVVENNGCIFRIYFEGIYLNEDALEILISRFADHIIINQPENFDIDRHAVYMYGLPKTRPVKLQVPECLGLAYKEGLLGSLINFYNDLMKLHGK